MAAGKKTGGRAKGTPNKQTAAIKEVVAQAVSEGVTPLEFLLSVMNSQQDLATRLDAAKAAAPYVHSKLSTVDAKVTGKIDSTITFETIYEGKP